MQRTENILTDIKILIQELENLEKDTNINEFVKSSKKMEVVNKIKKLVNEI